MNIDNFLKQVGLDSLFVEMGLTDLDETEKLTYTKKIMQLLHDRLKLRFLTMVEDSDREFLENVQSVDEMLSYMETKKNIDFDQIAVEEATSLREELIGTIQYVKGAMNVKPEDTQQ